MIKAIVFDYGGVLTNKGGFDPLSAALAAYSGKNQDDIYRLLKTIYSEAKVNNIPSRHVWEGIGHYVSMDPAEVKRHASELMGFNHDMFAFVKNLSSKYRLALLSNHIEDWLEGDIVKYGLRDVFEIIIGSYHVNCAKPDPVIYRYGIEALQCKPEECIFIDDKEINVEAAKKVGMLGIQFNGIVNLRQELEALGIMI